MSISGIYRIVHGSSGKSYVGSAVSVARRKGAHLRSLAAGEHPNPRLQAAWRKHGADAFVFEVLEVVREPALLIEREQVWIDALDAVASGFNIRLIAASNLGLKMGELTRQRMSASRKGLVMPRDGVEKARASNTGRVRTAAMRETIAASKRGRKMRPEHVLAMAARQVGTTRSAETRLKISIAQRGVPKSRESVEKIRIALTGKARSAESVAASAAGHRGKTRSPECRERMRLAQLLQHEKKRAAKLSEAV